jgi:hypothetical protein
VLRSWTRAGDHRFPGDPSYAYAFALLHDPGRAGSTSPLVVLPTPPPASKHRRPQRKIISRLTQGFSIRCLRFKSSVAAASLASGWRAAPLPGAGRTLWIAAKSFRPYHLPRLQDFDCRNQILSSRCGRCRSRASRYICCCYRTNVWAKSPINCNINARVRWAASPGAFAGFARAVRWNPR